MEVPALSVRTLLATRRITEIDLLLTDVQVYDREVVEHFLACGVNPTIIHFEHCHTSRPGLDALHRKLVEHGNRFNELENDISATGPTSRLPNISCVEGFSRKSKIKDSGNHFGLHAKSPLKPDLRGLASGFIGPTMG